jgi:uncharacterized protein YbcC (UPF0753/DUF2309 family)
MSASGSTPRIIPHHNPSPEDRDDRLRLLRLEEAIEHAAHLLPSQGPITVFVHHNTLHAFEELPFEEAVKKGEQLFGCQPYWTEDRYRRELARGRIRFADLRDVMEEDLGQRAGERILDLSTRHDLRLAMIQFPLRIGPTEELVWYVAETDALRRVRGEASSAAREQLIAETRHWVMRDLRRGDDPYYKGSRRNRWQRLPPGLEGIFERFNVSSIERWDDDEWEEFTLRALWVVCCHGIADVPPLSAPPPAPARHRDLLLAATDEDTDLLVHDVLVRFCAAFLDQGLAPWPLPRRDEGFFRAFCALYRQPVGPPDRWLRGLEQELARLEDAHITPLESIHESLETLGVAEAEWPDYLPATLLALRGWPGMIRQLELRGDRAIRPAPHGSLRDFLVIRLVLDRLALAFTAQEHLGFTGPLRDLRGELDRRVGKPQPPGVESRAFLVFQLAQILGWTPERLHRLKKREWTALLQEIEAFSSLERRRVFHLAYERRFYTRVLDAIALHAPRPVPTPRLPRFQALFCIDEREESLRRHLEELVPDAETFSAAGFFFIPMYYRGATEAHFTPLCPALMQPRHWVVEQVDDRLEESHQRRARVRRILGMTSHWFHIRSRAFAAGALLAAAVGVLASVPLVARILAPRLTARLRKRLGRIVQAPRLTQLRLERGESAPGPHDGQIGFTLDEMADIGERVLRDIGLTARFAPLVLVFGHGSTSLNNPHESAHDCGACGGARGGPNGRALAQMLNDPRVRERLEQRGLRLPADTFFIGGMHNTKHSDVDAYNEA